MQDMLERLESLSPEKRTLLVQLLKQQGKQFNVFPVSFAQQRMWVLDQLLAENSAYTISGGVRLSGPLHPDALQHALSSIVARHETLRTVFLKLSDLPVQVIQPATPLSLPAHDLSLLPPQQQQQEVQRRLIEESARPFDLARGPLLRPMLLRLSDTEHLLVVSIHHIVFDGWSLGVLIQELAQLYEAFVCQRSSPLPPLPLQYADFAQWQRSWQQGDEMQQHLAYWREQLVEPLPTLQLPTDRPRPALQRFVGAQVPFQVSASLTVRLQALSQQERATLFMSLLAAFEVLLFRYSGQSDLLIGTPIANRTRVELEGLIGCFINTLVLRGDLSGHPTFREVLRRVKQTALQAYAHQDLPFELLVEELQPQRDLSRNPLFQVMFVLQNAPLPPLRLTDLTVENLSLEVQTAKLDLTLVLWETSEGLQGHFEYDRDLFDEKTIVGLAKHLQILLEDVVATPDRRIGELALLTVQERKLLIEDWNATTQPSPWQYSPLHRLFEDQVLHTHEQPALLFEGESLSYLELNQQANRLAHHLRRLGVGPETLVGVCMHRSLELVISLLAILKAGGAYVPLDPSYPPERLTYMLDDAQVPLLLTRKELQEKLSALSHSLKLVCVDDGEVDLTQESMENLSVSWDASQLAYVIYTSGSTGRPKGAMNTHQAIGNRLWWMQQHFFLETGERVLQKTPFSFDVSVWEFFWPLLVGASLVIVRPEGHRDPAYLKRIIQTQQISTLHFVPSMLQSFLQEPDIEVCVGTLRRVICSGEALSRELQRHFQQRLPGVELHNLYGPTEAAVDVTAWHCQELRDEPIVPIGRPISNVQVYVLDPWLQPVPIGVSGELYIGGIALARGYWRRPDLTAEKFLPDPFSSLSGSRLYRTGDQVRLQADGVIEYLGRLDTQVKIRGFRIELGEIEATISKHPQVREVAVLAREDVPGDRQLVAYVVAGQAEVSAEELRSFLREHVPSYMLPAVFIWLEALPLTPNGKLDRRSLPAPEKSRSEHQYTPPRTVLEEQIARIWAQALGLECVGIHDNFFDIGGHSLLAIQVLSDMREQLQKRLSLSSFFTAQTIAEVVHLIEDSERSEPLCLVPIKVTGKRPSLYCFHPAGGEVLMYRALASCLDEDQSAYGVQSQALEGRLPEHPTIEAIAQAYVMAIRQQQPEGPYYLLGWSMGGVIAFAVASELERAGQKIALVGLLDAYLTSAELVLAQKADALEGLGVIIEVALMQTFETLSLEEQIRMREGLLALPPEERLQRALSWGKERQILPHSLSLEALRMQEALVNTHIDLVNTYQAPVIETPVVTWLAREADYVPQERTNWGLHTKGGVQELMADGTHFTMIQQPHIQNVAQQLKDILRTISGGN